MENTKVTPEVQIIREQSTHATDAVLLRLVLG